MSTEHCACLPCWTIIQDCMVISCSSLLTTTDSSYVTARVRLYHISHHNELLSYCVTLGLALTVTVTVTVTCLTTDPHRLSSQLATELLYGDDGMIVLVLSWLNAYNNIFK